MDGIPKQVCDGLGFGGMASASSSQWQRVIAASMLLLLLRGKGGIKAQQPMCGRDLGSAGCVISCTVAEDDNTVGVVLSRTIPTLMGLNLTGRTTSLSFQAADPLSRVLVVDMQSGELTFNGTIDYERTNSGALSGLLIAVQTSSTTPANASSMQQQVSKCDLTVSVRDQNDRPRFDVGYQASVRENSPVGTSVLQVSAVDDDTDPAYSNISYLIATYSNPTCGLTPLVLKGEDRGALAFRINRKTGLVTVSNSSALDFEHLRSYMLFIVATDGFFCTVSIVTVIVIDSNEIPPVLSLVTNIPGFSPRHFLAEGFATPADLTLGIFKIEDAETNPILNVTVAGGAGKFYMEFAFTLSDAPHYYLRVVAGTVFDRELQSQYHLTIVGRDDQEPRSFVTMLDFTLTITDVDDSSPIFSPRIYSARVVENDPSAQLTALVQLYAEDPDVNDTVVYSIQSVNGDLKVSMFPFSISTTSGEVFATSALDYEVVQLYQLLVRATSQHNESRYDTALVNITVIDVNDNSPVFNQPVYTFSVLEGSEGSQMVGVVSATDADNRLASSVQYALGGDGISVFDIGTESGVIHTRQHASLNRESRESYTFEVFAFDSGVPRLNSSAVVHVTVQDSNDNGPMFKPNEVSMHYLSNISVGHVIARLVVIDPDTAVNSRVQFSLVPAATSTHSNSTVHMYFKIVRVNSSSVALVVSAPLSGLGNTTFNLVVKATDLTTSGNTEARADVEIAVVSVLPPKSPGGSGNTLATPILILIIVVGVALVIFFITLLIVKWNLNRKKKIFEVQAQINRAPSLYKSRENVFDNPLAHEGSYKVRPDVLPMESEDQTDGTTEPPTTNLDSVSAFPGTLGMESKSLGTPGSLREMAKAKGRSRSVVYSATASELDLAVVGNSFDKDSPALSWNRQPSTKTVETQLGSLVTTPSSGSGSRTGSMYFTTESSDDGGTKMTKNHSQSEFSLSQPRPQTLLADYNRQKTAFAKDGPRLHSPRKSARQQPVNAYRLSPQKTEANRSLYASTPSSLSGRSTPGSLADEDYSTRTWSPHRKPNLDRHHSVAGEKVSARLPPGKKPVARRVSFNKYPEMQV